MTRTCRRLALALAAALALALGVSFGPAGDRGSCCVSVRAAKVR
jgi:adenine/guanine phosphoribosyltransferase-like PRPP-binding protein